MYVPEDVNNEIKIHVAWNEHLSTKMGPRVKT